MITHHAMKITIRTRQHDHLNRSAFFAIATLGTKESTFNCARVMFNKTHVPSEGSIEIDS